MAKVLIWGICLALFLLSFSRSHAADIAFDSTYEGQSFEHTSEITIPFTLTIQAANDTKYYLRGVFYKEGSSKYCGFTWNGAEYFSGPYTVDNAHRKFLPVVVTDGAVRGEMQVKIDPENAGCVDSGLYKFRIQRFTESGSASFDDQPELSFNFTLPTATPLPTETPKPTKTTAPAKTSAPTYTNVPTIKTTPTLIAKRSASPSRRPTFSLQEKTREKAGGVKGVSEGEKVALATQEANSSWSTAIVTGIGLIVLACAIILFRFYKKRHEENDI